MLLYSQGHASLGVGGVGYLGFAFFSWCWLACGSDLGVAHIKKRGKQG